MQEYGFVASPRGDVTLYSRFLGVARAHSTRTILRGAGYYTTPPMDDGCVFSATLQGSLWPELPVTTPDRMSGNTHHCYQLSR